MSPVPDAVVRFVRSRLGAGVVDATPLSGGLALRRFLRLRLDRQPGTLVARIEAAEDPHGRPPGVPPEPPLEPLRSFLEEAGLPVPRSYGHDAGLGIDLLEDLGDHTLADASQADAGGAARGRLYSRVCSLVPRLQGLADPGGLPAFHRRLDRALFAYKADLFARSSLPLALGRRPTPAESDAVATAFGWIAERCMEAPARLAHRDLQSHNVLLRASGAPVLIDLQGALLAPPEYDLVCLLRDSYAELTDAELTTQLERVRPLLPDAPDPASFRLRFDLLTLTRKGKDHARFVDVAAAPRRRRVTSASCPRRCARCAVRRGACGAWRRGSSPCLEWIGRLRPDAPRRGSLPDGATARERGPGAMRAMIVAAGLGTRLRPLTAAAAEARAPGAGTSRSWRIPLRAARGRRACTEVVDQPASPAGASCAPTPSACGRPALELHFSHEPGLLHTGGAIRRVADFLRESDPCLVIGGDMIVDLDLAGLVARHVDSGREVSFALGEASRAPQFATVGLDAAGRLRRVAARFDLGGEAQAGVYTWVNVVSARALDTLPEREAFNHLDDWLAPRAAGGAPIGGEVLPVGALRFEPVGTPDEYLAANLTPLHLSYLDADARARAAGVRLGSEGVIGAGARVGAGAVLHNVVVWDGERVPAGAILSDGVFAGGTFHAWPGPGGSG